MLDQPPFFDARTFMNNNSLQATTRRQFFKETGVGLGSIALASLLDDKLFAQQIQHHAPDFAATNTAT